MKKWLISILLSVATAFCQVDFLPHDLTSATSHSPYKIEASSWVSAPGDTYAPWKSLDGGLGLWAGYQMSLPAAADWLLIDLDWVTGVTEITPHDLTSEISHVPIVTSASTQFSAAFASWMTLDGVVTQHWCGTDCCNDWLKYDFGVGNEFVLSYYDIDSTVANPERFPKSWTLQGSNNDVDWTTISTVADQLNWGSLESRRFYATGGSASDIKKVSLVPMASVKKAVGVANADIKTISLVAGATATAYRYYKLNILAVNSAALLNQVQEVHFYEARTGSPATKICGSYAIKAPSSDATRAPKDWTLKGSNNKSTWDTLDTVTGEVGWALNETRVFTADVATTAYEFFKFLVTASNGSGYLEIVEWYLYEP